MKNKYTDAIKFSHVSFLGAISNKTKQMVKNKRRHSFLKPESYNGCSSLCQSLDLTCVTDQ